MTECSKCLIPLKDGTCPRCLVHFADRKTETELYRDVLGLLDDAVIRLFQAAELAQMLQSPDVAEKVKADANAAVESLEDVTDMLDDLLTPEADDE